MKLLTFSVFALAFSISLRAGAQARPGISTDGSRVLVRAYVSLSDEITPYVPISGVSLDFYRDGKMVSVVTDSAGAASIMLLPGEYRVISRTVQWKGRPYSWSVPIVVRSAMLVDLKRDNATQNAGPVQTEARPDVEQSKSAQHETRIVYVSGPGLKDPSTAFLWSFFIPGAGQMYAGETAKGVGLFTVSTLGEITLMGALLADMQCPTTSYGSTCERNVAPQFMVGGLVLWAVPWVYSMIDAGPAVDRYNASHRFANVSLAPTYTRNERGRAFGLAVSVQR